MPVKIIDPRRDIPKPSRKRKSAVEDTEEWMYIKTKLAAGLKPHEGLEVTLPPKLTKKIKNAPRMLQKRVKKYLASLGLDKQYDVFLRGTTSEEDSPVIVYVAGRSDLI